MSLLTILKQKREAKKIESENKKYKIINIYLHLDATNFKIYAYRIPHDPDYIPFTITPQPKSYDERYAFRMYPSNNLYRILTNGGIELNKEQKAIIKNACKNLIGNGKYDKIENEDTATITKKELHELLDKLAYTLSRQQCDLIKENGFVPEVI